MIKLYNAVGKYCPHVTKLLNYLLEEWECALCEVYQTLVPYHLTGSLQLNEWTYRNQVGKLFKVRTALEPTT